MPSFAARPRAAGAVEVADDDAAGAWKVASKAAVAKVVLVGLVARVAAGTAGVLGFAVAVGETGEAAGVAEELGGAVELELVGLVEQSEPVSGPE